MLASRSHTAARGGSGALARQARCRPQHCWYRYAAASRRPAVAPRAAAADSAGTSSSEGGASPAAAAARLGRRYEVTLRKPVGVVFAQKDGGPVFIESVVPGGNADKAGIKPGDILSACSAITLKAGKEGRFEREGYGDRPYDNFESIMIDCEGLKFETVMGALKSNNERWGIKDVTLVIRRADEE